MHQASHLPVLKYKPTANKYMQFDLAVYPLFPPTRISMLEVAHRKKKDQKKLTYFVYCNLF